MVQNYGTTQQVTIVDTVGNPVSLGSESNNFSSATEAKQNEAVPQATASLVALLERINQQLDFANGIGAVQPSQTAMASSTVQEIFALSNIRKRVRITNHSPADSILIELNGDASLFRGQIIPASGTWESPGREEARSRITVISETGNNVDISYQETIDFVLFFDIAEPTFANQNANLIDISYSITITDSLGYLSSLTVGLYEVETEELLEEQNFTTGLNNGATINVTFLQIDAVEKTFYILIETN